jgi:unsaturated rhamnogalacturonyl hydrolase
MLMARTQSYSEMIADTVMRRYPSADNYPYRPWCYSQGFLLWGFIRLYEKTGEARYRDYVMDYCEKHVKPDGSVPVFTGVSRDDIMAGSVLVWAYTHTKEEKYKRACQTVRRAFDDYPRNEDGGFWHGRGLPREMWVDGLFMGLMFLTRYGRYIEDAEYCYAETVRQLSIVFDVCEKDGSGLLYHAYSEDRSAPWAHPVTGKSPEVWSEGLGWYAMILVDVLELLPPDRPGVDRLKTQLRKLIDALEKVQDPTSGLWCQVVDKPGYPRNWHDTSGSAMFLYTIKKAGLSGFADRAQCETMAEKAINGLKTKCLPDAEGNINVYDACDGVCVQMDYDVYVDYLRNANAKEAVAACLWAFQIMETGV